MVDMNSTELLQELGFSEDEILKILLLKEKAEKCIVESNLPVQRRLEFYRFLYQRGDLNETKVSQPVKRQIVGIRRFLREHRMDR